MDADRLSELLRLGGLKPVYHGASALLTLKELVRSYVALVEDGTRVMLRIKALFRARGIRTPGMSVYRQSTRKEWLARLEERGARMSRGETRITLYGHGGCPHAQRPSFDVRLSRQDAEQ